MAEYKTPILFIIFNRKEVTEKVFAEIQKIKPGKLYIAADGPRKNIQQDAENCKQTRDAVLNNINWECEVKTLLRDENLGCRKAVSSAITWFFENEEKGIILEDDCLPDVSFFHFCSLMLEHYQDKQEIMMICGTCLLPEDKTENDYYFSKLTMIWGWATWRRAWAKYDLEMKEWPVFKKSGYYEKVYGKLFAFDLVRSIDKCYNKLIDTWDFQWNFCISSNNGLSIFPKKNLISNIGDFGTHMQGDNPLTFKKIFPLEVDKLIMKKTINQNYTLDKMVLGSYLSQKAKAMLAIKIVLHKMKLFR